MTDSFDRLEQELSAMRPRHIHGELIERIGATLERRPSNDGMLKCSMGFGAVAASIIAGLLCLEPRTFTAAPPLQTNEAMRFARSENFPQAFAWMDRHSQLNIHLENP